jgi:hypothetical protein
MGCVSDDDDDEGGEGRRRMRRIKKFAKRRASTFVFLRFVHTHNLFLDSVSNADYMASNCRLIVNNELGRCEMRWSWSDLNYNTGICLKVLTKPK